MVAGELGEEDIGGVMKGRSAVGWLENAEQQTLVRWGGSGGMAAAPPVPL